MTTTRPSAAVSPARPPEPDRDEYPVLGANASASSTTGIVMGPTPEVHLGKASLPESVVPLPRVRAVRPQVSPATPIRHEQVRPEHVLDRVSDAFPLAPVPTMVVRGSAPQAAIVVPVPAEDARPDLPEWKPVDPQTARAALRVEREVEIPRGRRTRRPRSPELSSGDAAERMHRLVTLDQRRRAIMVAASAIAALAILAAIWRFADLGYAVGQPVTSWNQIAVPDSTTGTPAASPTSSASQTPSVSPTTSASATSTDEVAAQPTQTPSTAQVPAALRANAIYGSTVTGSCPEQTTPASPDDAKAALTAYVDCMNAVWSPVLGEGKIRFRPARINFYVNTVVSACTTLHTSDPIAATYCPLDATIYVSPSGVDSAVGSRFNGAELVTHEYAHHVQSLSQILAVAGKQGWSDDEYSRRVELQAHCLAFAVLNHVDGFGPDPATFRFGWKAGPGSATNGSIASLQYWGERGLAANKVGDCDTFSVPQSAVA